MDNDESREAELVRHREAIDALDLEILTKLSERAGHAKAIGVLKANSGAHAYRPEREAQVLARIATSNAGPLSHDLVTGIFRQIMSACLALEQPLRIAYLGPPGTFSHAAVGRHFGQFVEPVSCVSIDEVFRAAESGLADYGVTPVENSTEGAVGRTLDLVCQTDLSICGEVKLRIHQNLMSNADALDKVTCVYSHAQSLAQCTLWLARNLPTAQRVPVSSNAEGARRARDEDGTAAIAGETAADVYGLKLLATEIEDRDDNTTRFFVVGRKIFKPSGDDRTTILCSALHTDSPGALFRLLEPLAKHKISLTRIESRPSHRKKWDYVFFFDIDGHADEPHVAKALAALKKRASLFRVLGSYPRAVS